MKLGILHELNAERAARRPVIVVTDTADGEQRLVKAAESPPIRLRADWPSSCAWARADDRGRRQEAIPQRLRADRAARHRGAVHIARRWRRWRARSATTSRWSIRARPLRAPSAFPTCRWSRNGRTRRCRRSIRSLHGVRHLTHDPKIDDPALLHALRARLLLYRRARLAEDPCQARRAAEGAGREGADIARIHAPIGLDIGASRPPKSRWRSWPRSPRGCGCRAKKEQRHEIRPGHAGGREGGVTVHSLRQGPLVLKKGRRSTPTRSRRSSGRRQGRRRGAAQGGRRL